MSRDSRAHSSGPPSSRGIPRAGQNPDPSWFGRRAQGERREAAEQEQPEGQTTQVPEVGWATVSIRFIEDAAAFLVALPQQRFGENWTLTPNNIGKIKDTKFVQVQLTDADISHDELMDALQEAVERLQRNSDRAKMPSALHPGSRKRLLQLS